MTYLYILKSRAFAKTYVGITHNITKRVVEHNSGHSIYTSKYRPWYLIYSEEFSDRIKARQREKYFKSAAGRRKIKNLNIPG